MLKINKELYRAMQQSKWFHIPYDSLIKTTPEAIRAEEAKLSLEENPLETPVNLEVRNLILESDMNALSVRLYKPKNKSGLPVMLYFHGGAFIFGTPEQYDSLFYKLTLDTEMIVMSVDYRLAPENPYPAAIEDGYFALTWLQNHAEKIGGDSDKIIISGSSAGGTLAMSVTHYARDRKNKSIGFQHLLYPPTDNRLQTLSMQELAQAPMQTKKAAKYMWKHYLGTAITSYPNYAVPLQQTNFSGLPPASIFICELDPLKDEAIAYAKKLEEANVPVNLIEMKGAVHAFDFFPCKLSEIFYQKQVKVLRSAIQTMK